MGASSSWDSRLVLCPKDRVLRGGDNVLLRAKAELFSTVRDRKRRSRKIIVNRLLEVRRIMVNRLPPPRTLIMDFTMAHVRFGRSYLHPIGQLTHTRRSDGAPDPDGSLKEEVRIKICHYRNIYLNRPDPIVFLSLAVDTSDRLYDDFICLIFLHGHREASVLVNELPEESDQFRFLRTTCLSNLKGSVSLILEKVSEMRISIPLDLSSRSCIPLSRFIRSRLY